MPIDSRFLMPADITVTQFPPPVVLQWSVSITAGASSEGRNTNLDFGVRPGATDGFDISFDVPHPPTAPDAAFDAYFSISHPVFPKLDRDYRAPLLTMTDVRVWTLKVKSESQQITLTWDASQIPSDLYAYMDTGTGTIDMKAQNNLTLPAGEYTLIIRVSHEMEVQVSLHAGWNMVSVPVLPLDTSVSAVFPGVAAVFTWDAAGKTYIMPTSVEPDTGYWVAVLANTTISVTGVPVLTWTSPLKAGWNMIGSVIGNASIANPNDSPDGSVLPFAYWWDPVSKGYAFVTIIETGKGYWVASVQDCMLTIP